MENNQIPRTFWELLNAHPVKIPKIQRDYVQGRAIKQVEHAQEMLFHDIEAALYGGKHLDLNFIYGKVDSKNNFLPIDGQQRLTTIFLMFVFAINNEQSPKPEDIEILRGFKYDTRRSTGEFIKQLLDHTGDFSMCNCSIEDSLRDQNWFRAEWISDPTVFSMLKVLNKIQDRFSDKHELLERLKSASITFHYQNTEGIGDEDDLYIKLNARGRLLSDFENLKSEIEEALAGELKESFSIGIDGKWRDFFWQLMFRQKAEKEGDISIRFDNACIRFFHWYFYCRTLLVNNNDAAELREKKDYYRLSDYNIDVAQAISELKTILDNLCEDLSSGGADSISSWFTDCLGEGSIGLESIVKFWAYVIRHKYKLNDEAIEAWLRIETHLIENSEYNAKNIFNAIRSINVINDFSENLMSAFAEDKIPEDLPAINGNMIQEEKRKSKLMLSSSDWNEAILSAESELPYFNGQIGFLLDFSGSVLEAFKLYHRKAALIFDAEKGEGIHNEKHNIFQRALLTFGEYYSPDGSFNFNVINKSLRGKSWREVLANSKSDKRAYIKELLDKINVEDEIIMQLQQFIQDFSLVEDWRYNFIKTDGVISFMRYGVFKIMGDCSARTLLIPRINLCTTNAEYRTYSLFCILKAKGLCSEEDYQFNRSSNEIYCHIPGKDIKVISRANNPNLLLFQGDVLKAECCTVEEVLSLLETH